MHAARRSECKHTCSAVAALSTFKWNRKKGKIYTEEEEEVSRSLCHFCFKLAKQSCAPRHNTKERAAFPLSESAPQNSQEIQRFLRISECYFVFVFLTCLGDWPCLFSCSDSHEEPKQSSDVFLPFNPQFSEYQTYHCPQFDLYDVIGMITLFFVSRTIFCQSCLQFLLFFIFLLK